MFALYTSTHLEYLKTGKVLGPVLMKIKVDSVFGYDSGSGLLK